jgi:hypothetical protein
VEPGESRGEDGPIKNRAPIAKSKDNEDGNRGDSGQRGQAPLFSGDNVSLKR